jgi:hypothetical protein
MAATNWSNFPEDAAVLAQYKRSPSADKAEMRRQLIGGGSFVSNNTPEVTATPMMEKTLTQSSVHRHQRIRNRRFLKGTRAVEIDGREDSTFPPPNSPLACCGEL